MNIVILDDNQEVSSEMEKMVREVFFDAENICSFHNIDELFSISFSIDLLFIDVKLNDINGIEFVKNHHDFFQNSKVVYFTGYDFAEDIFKTNPYYYLKKPVTVDKIRKVYEKIHSDNDIISVKFDKEIKRVYVKDIIYIDSYARVVSIHLTQGEIVKTYTNLDSIYKLLPNNFIRIHKGYIVNLKMVKKYTKYRVTLFNGMDFSISRNYAESVREKFMQYVKESDLCA